MTRYITTALLLGGLTLSGQLLAGSQEQAKRLHDRLAGVPPTPSTLATMATAIDSGDAIDAAYTAMESEHFYNVTLKLFAAPWTNRDQSIFVPFNDYIATVIGMVRDDVDFRQVLQGDILYTGDASLGLPAYNASNNAHYEAMEAQDVNLKTGLVRTTQSSLTGVPANATAGVMTTRAAAKSFFIAGTNRAMFRFTLMNFMCRDLEQVHDTSRIPDRIRQDVTRSPGGDSRVFMNNCIGCHNGMDPLAQAFAYYDFEYDAEGDPEGNNGRISYNDAGQLDPATGTRVEAKYHFNANNFIYGYVTPDDGWDNYWRDGPNSLLGWDPSLSGSGSGAKTMGQELAHSEAFAQCQVEKVFANVCLRPPVDGADRGKVSEIVGSFKASGYQLKQVFAETAVYCMGE
ncbi:MULTISPECIES: hypothetical protein [Corallincola]|uniref:DUF1585 domain-containing protein n=3 Tax=Corallincola TaxID=1775176 RepID=A0A368NKV0_9GAMM|nr:MULTISPECIES: hypothetical protein [Corallincola]RCU50039.1 hypothetical protein DU002_10505 [Corallincola holothuriorum]TAA44979.1 hypothetical protein EXY25_12255 [Corallincola spongiicola]TCI03761.1 hypothetical protein EZV61_09490 [Corallincola luteus]